MATAVPVTHAPDAPVAAQAEARSGGEAAAAAAASSLRAWTVFRAGWRPALGWTLAPCALYGFVVGPLLGRPTDPAQVLALLTAAGALIAARSFEKTRGLA